MWELIISGAILAAEYGYNWYIHRNDQPPVTPGQTIKIPTAQPGATLPMFYGACLVRTPVLAWIGSPAFVNGAVFSVTAQYNYGLNMHLIAGVFPQGGSCNLLKFHVGEAVLGIGAGDGSTASPFSMDNSTLPDAASQYIGGQIEVLRGGPTQDPVADGTHLYGQMNLGPNPPLSQFIPGYRDVLSVVLFGPGGTAPWQIGATPQPGSYGIECYGWLPGLGSGMVGAFTSIYGLIPADCCPTDVIFDLLTGSTSCGKLGLSSAVLDLTSFSAASTTLLAEGHGFSRSWEDSGQAVVDRINEVLRQIDGVIFEDLTTGLITIKLIRADYDPSTIAEITPENCEEIQNFNAGGEVGLPNDIYITFTDRGNNYKTGQARARNPANADGQNGEVYQLTLNMPGINNGALADQVAQRTLQAQSRPRMTCRAVVNRSFLRTHPGDVLKLTWPEANISGVCMRVSDVGRGTLENGAILLDLIQDYYYVNRFTVSNLGLGQQVNHFGGG